MNEILTVAITALIAGPMGALVVAIVNRDKNDAALKAQIIKSARELMDEYDQQADKLQLRIEHLEHEAQAAATAIENLNAQVLKYRLALIITVMQLRLAGFEPMIDPNRIDTMTVDELRMIAEGTRNAEERKIKTEEERRNKQ